MAEAEDRIGIEIHAANGVPFGMWVDYEWDGRNPQADLIEKACNSHYDLLAACKCTVQQLADLHAAIADLDLADQFTDDSIDMMSEGATAIAEARAAIAKAKP